MASCFTVLGRNFSTTASCGNVFKHVTIVGGGLMGSGIAQVTAQSGMDVTIIEVSEDAVKKSEANIKDSIQRVAKKLFQSSSSDAEKYINESMERLKISLDLKETVATTDLVVEAIVENLEAKHKLFSKIDAIAPQHTIFASNTSSLPIKEIAAVTHRKDRFGGLHFFNPVPVMKLLEVIKTDETSEDTYQKLMAWGRAIGKTTITCKDTPGFVVNRLLIPYLADAVRMLERGDASAKDIDVAMKLGAGYPMGPLELLDYVGLDTTKFILDGWHEKFPDHPLFAPIPLLDKLVSEGKFGRKTGEGFYAYSKKTAAPVSFFIHSPYFQPLPTEKAVSFPLQTHPEQRDTLKQEKVPKLKIEKEDAVETYMEPVSYPRYENYVKKEKLERLKKFKSLEQWKDTDDFINSDRGRIGYKRSGGPRRFKYKHGDNYISTETYRTLEKLKNWEILVKLEREREQFIRPQIVKNMGKLI